MTHPEHLEQLPPDLFPTLTVCWTTMDRVQTENALEETRLGRLDHRSLRPRPSGDPGVLGQSRRFDRGTLGPARGLGCVLLRHGTARGAARVAPELRRCAESAY